MNRSFHIWGAFKNIAHEIKMAESIRKAISDVLEEAKIYSCDKWDRFYYR
jgi:hypothetical protein